MRKLLFLLFASCVMTSAYAIGAFSVSASKQVEFSSGNVQYHTGNDQWRFADYQYDIIGEADNITLGTPGHSAWIDLFGWSCESVPYGVSPSNKDADYTGDFIDWGNEFEGGWYTPTKDEWQYLPAVPMLPTCAARARWQATTA